MQGQTFLLCAASCRLAQVQACGSEWAFLKVEMQPSR